MKERRRRAGLWGERRAPQQRKIRALRADGDPGAGGREPRAAEAATPVSRAGFAGFLVLYNHSGATWIIRWPLVILWRTGSGRCRDLPGCARHHGDMPAVPRVDPDTGRGLRAPPPGPTPPAGRGGEGPGELPGRRGAQVLPGKSEHFPGSGKNPFLCLKKKGGADFEGSKLPVSTPLMVSKRPSSKAVTAIALKCQQQLEIKST